jgi:hypothetical protein
MWALFAKGPAFPHPLSHSIARCSQLVLPGWRCCQTCYQYFQALSSARNFGNILFVKRYVHVEKRILQICAFRFGTETCPDHFAPFQTRKRRYINKQNIGMLHGMRVPEISECARAPQARVRYRWFWHSHTAQHAHCLNRATYETGSALNQINSACAHNYYAQVAYICRKYKGLEKWDEQRRLPGQNGKNRIHANIWAQK